MRWKILTILYVFLLAFVSLRPGSGEEPAGSVQMLLNLAHIPAYAVLTYLLTRCFSRFHLREQLLTASGAFIFGVLLETGQLFVAHRYFSPRDMVFNGAGILIAIFALRSAKARP